MLDPTLAKAQAISAFLDVIADSKDLGVVPANDPRLAPRPRCDVCGRRPRSGHLLEGSHGFAIRLTPNGPTTSLSVSICSLGPGEEQDGRYWVCDRCFTLLREDRVSLIREILEEP